MVVVLRLEANSPPEERDLAARESEGTWPVPSRVTGAFSPRVTCLGEREKKIGQFVCVLNCVLIVLWG